MAQRPQEVGVVHRAKGRVIDFWVAFSEVVIIVRTAHQGRLDSLPLGGQTLRRP